MWYFSTLSSLLFGFTFYRRGNTQAQFEAIIAAAAAVRKTNGLSTNFGPAWVPTLTATAFVYGLLLLGVARARI